MSQNGLEFDASYALVVVQIIQLEEKVHFALRCTSSHLGAACQEFFVVNDVRSLRVEKIEQPLTEQPWQRKEPQKHALADGFPWRVGGQVLVHFHQQTHFEVIEGVSSLGAGVGLFVSHFEENNNKSKK